MTTSPQVLDGPTEVLHRAPAAAVDGPTQILDRAPAPPVDVLDLAVPLPAMPLVDALFYDLVVRDRLCDPLIEAMHDVELRAAALPLPTAAAVQPATAAA
ncbi:hypothetical protein JNW90_00750 [Micromonospora sp. STR1s_5]|nr:hypothetical protein [Micromonospora sp. STR1s_5]